SCHYNLSVPYLLPPIAFLFFLSHTLGAPRALHSFPTRRSSDLGAASRAPALESSCISTAVATAGWRCAPSSGSPSSRWSTTPPRDRKSTRLNSSHVAISYAVFCLKKKKKKKKTAGSDILRTAQR